MKKIEQDVLRTAEDHFAESPSLEERVARIEACNRVKNCSRTMRAALTRKMRKAWALRLRKMGKCATPACLL